MINAKMLKISQRLNFSSFNNIQEINKAKEEKSKIKNEDIVNNVIERTGTSLNDDEINSIYDLIDEIKDKNGIINEDGYVTCYYALSKYNKKSYEKEGVVGAGSDKVMFSTRNSNNLKKYGDTILELKIPIEKLFFSASTSKEVLLKIPFKSSLRKLNIKQYLVKK